MTRTAGGTIRHNNFETKGAGLGYKTLMNAVPHILFVDDHREIRDLVSRALAREGYRVSTAADGRAMRKTLVYGERRPAIQKNNRVCYSKFPGSPRYRGHPIVVID